MPTEKFIKSVNKYLSTTEDNDAFLLLCFNNETIESIGITDCNWERLATLVQHKHLNTMSENSKEVFGNVRDVILNIAFNVLLDDSEKRIDFINNLLANEKNS